MENKNQVVTQLTTLHNMGRRGIRPVHAFTLIELLVVILIIGILAAIALPQYSIAVSKARVKRTLPLLRTIALAQEAYYLTYGTYTTDIDVLDVTVPYTSKGNEFVGGWGHERQYTGVNGGRLHLYRDKHAMVWDDSGVVLDMYLDVNQIMCYSYGKNAWAERICSALGRKMARTDKYYRSDYYRLQ